MTNRITEPSKDYSQSNQRQIQRDLATRFAALEKTIGPYMVTNFTPTRSLDMGTAGTADIGNFIATLVSDLQAVGRISKPG